MIPVVDIFAGPGGLGEGFSDYTNTRGEQVFQVCASIEKDEHAHQTLRLRAFFRCFRNRALPPEYERVLAGRGDWETLAAASPLEAKTAEREALRLVLTPEPKTVSAVRRLVRDRVGDADPWVLVGGPPCQAYSLVGRARNSGSETYDADLDPRQTLYFEYLQVLADHRPTVFVMENVKGLLSAKHKKRRVFDGIFEDLMEPKAGLQRIGRHSTGGASKYRIHSLVLEGADISVNPKDFVVRTEEYGIPQNRHRVILVGVREDAAVNRIPTLVPSRRRTVRGVIADLPPLRSRLSKGGDSLEIWHDTLRSFKGRRWLTPQPANIRAAIEGAIDEATASHLGVGSNHAILPDDKRVLNHDARGHIAKDLARYMFVSAFGQECGRSPTLKDFPADLLPKHANVERALKKGHFSDRFRAQLADHSSSTITSHISRDGHYYIHYDPAQCRSLSVREAAGLQTFPDDFFFCGPRTEQYVQVGNAVPPALARQIAASVAAALGRG